MSSANRRSVIVVLVLCGALRSEGQPLKSTLLLSVDVACDVSIDGEAPLKVVPGRASRLTVGAGQHLVTANCEGGEPWEKVVDALPDQQQVVTIRLQQDRKARAALVADVDTILIGAANALADVNRLIEAECTQYVNAQSAQWQAYQQAMTNKRNAAIVQGIAAGLGQTAPEMPGAGSEPTLTKVDYVRGNAAQQADGLLAKLTDDLGRVQTDDPLRRSLREDLASWGRAFQSIGDAVCGSRMGSNFPDVRRLTEFLELPAAKDSLTKDGRSFWTLRQTAQKQLTFIPARREALRLWSGAGGKSDQEAARAITSQLIEQGDQIAVWWKVVTSHMNGQNAGVTSLMNINALGYAGESSTEVAFLSAYDRWFGLTRPATDAKKLVRAIRDDVPSICPPSNMGTGVPCGLTAAVLASMKEYKDALPLSRRACDAGVAFSCAQLGIMLVSGNGAKADPAAGVQYLSQACAANVPTACDTRAKLCGASRVPSCQ
jgi:hypothetical protein